ncbi:MAG: GGDEF domain-containing protein [Limnochordia bacterium]
MPTVSGIMSPNPVTTGPFRSVAEAASLMEEHQIGCLPVENEGELVGIITSRDIRKSHPNRLVADCMTRNVITVPPDCSLWEAHALMTSHCVERLVVMDNGRIKGVITESVLNKEIGKHVDGLTGLRRADYVKEAARRLLQEGQEIAVVFLDLDNFRFVDKKLGHVLGDAVLKKAAAILQSLVDADQDCLCRYAGDEFAVVTLRPMEEAAKLALRMTSAIAEESWPLGVSVTASAGVAGGRRRAPRQNAAADAANLINMASLASTKAKELKEPVFVAKGVSLEQDGIFRALLGQFEQGKAGAAEEDQGH